MSQDAEKSQLPKVGIEPGLQDLKENTLPRRCKSQLLPQGSRSVLYTYTDDKFSCSRAQCNVRQMAKIKNQYNQLQHLTQDANASANMCINL